MKYFEADDIKKQKPQKASITQLLLEKNSFLFAKTYRSEVREIVN